MPQETNPETLGVEFVLEESLFKGARSEIFELRMPRNLPREQLGSISTLDDTAILKRVDFDALFPNKGRIESTIHLPGSLILSPHTFPDNSSISGGVNLDDLQMLYFNTWVVTQMPLTLYFKVTCQAGGVSSYQLVQQLLEAGGFSGEMLRHGKSSWVVSIRGVMYINSLPADRATIEFGAPYEADPGELSSEFMPPSAVVVSNATRFTQPFSSFDVNVTRLPPGGLRPIDPSLDDFGAEVPSGPGLGGGSMDDEELNDWQAVKQDLAPSPEAAPAQPGAPPAPWGAERSPPSGASSAPPPASSPGGSDRDAAPSPPPTSNSPTAALAVGFSLAGAAVAVMAAIAVYWQCGGRRVRVVDDNEDTVYKAVA